MTICDVGHFLGVIVIGLVVGSTLGYGVGFASELASWFLFGVLMFRSNLRDPFKFTLRELDVLGCRFLSCFDVGLLFLFTHVYLLASREVSFLVQGVCS